MTDLLQIVPPDQAYWVLHREDEDQPWQRQRVTAWALVDDGPTVPNYVAGLVLDRDGVTHVVAPPGPYMTQREWDALGWCRCREPRVSDLERFWCSFCGCETPR